ncbi:CHAP domain-containing protein [Pyxidicoccus fallax]|uniref:C40 family peptidase n=1 Tax=Pyxidicoccus fallax TaxID=394095 RepID=A0A848LHW7_9BACT|nr:CHAP domain-containing protein [Pyxidicoccus fallax]NMO16608.1 C40 family peptidase [Pyxidicoccus fallax]NPC80803.1 CHAP domain-containing protein [Pyxidicoccus fallax]
MLRHVLVVAVAVLTSVSHGSAHAAARAEAPVSARAAVRQASPASKKKAAPKRKAVSRPQVGQRIAGRAAGLVGVASLRTVSDTVPDDCTGLVRLAYSSAGIDLMAPVPGRRGENGVTHIYRAVRRRGALHRTKPRPGDLVFFRETYDRDRDGRRDDGLTHVGVVEHVSAGGLVTFIHRGGKGVARSRMHLRWPTTHRARTRRVVLNDYLRRASREHRAYVTGELFAGFASPEALAPSSR